MSLSVLILHAGLCLTTCVLLVGRQGPDRAAAVRVLSKYGGVF